MTRMLWIALPLSALVALSACGDKSEVTKTEGSSSASASASSASASASASGNQPGVKMEVVNPDVTLKSDDFSIEGVKLFPASVIKKMNVEQTSDAAKGKFSKTEIGFESPAPVKEVADWFEAEMKKANFTVVRSGDDMSGKTPQGAAFELEIDDAGGGKAKGEIEIKRAQPTK